MEIVNHHAQCPFCSSEVEQSVIEEAGLAFAILDRFPVSRGHALIIPKYHTADYFQLPDVYQEACWELMRRVQSMVREQYHPDGFNIGINIHEAAGQTVPHVHIHLIPRYAGDVDEPRGGVRGVIPHKQSY